MGAVLSPDAELIIQYWHCSVLNFAPDRVIAESAIVMWPVKVAVKQIASPGIFKFFNHYLYISPPLSPSPLFLQLYRSHGDSVVSWLPRGLWKQPQLRVADYLWAWHQNPLSLQWLWPGASLWLPHYQRWGPVRSHNTRTLLRGRSSFPPDVQQQRAAAGVSGWSLYVWAGVQHHL